MATIEYDSELMDNHIAATPISAHTSIVTLLHPKSRRPAVLGLSNDQVPAFNLISENADGTRVITDLRKPLKLGDSVIQAFTAQQDSDLRVYLVVAAQLNDTLSFIYVMKPFSLDNIVGDNYPVNTIATVQSLYMGPPTKNDPYPMILAAHKELGSITAGSDISRIYVNDVATTILDHFELPQNADRILDICAASHPDFGSGIWALTSVQGSVSLIGQYASRDEDSGRMQDMAKTLNCPPDATCIESVLEGGDRTGLLIGAGKGLTYVDADTCVQPHEGDPTVGTLINTDDIFLSPMKLVVAQDGNEVTIWSLGSAGDLGYLNSKASSLQTRGHSSATKAIGLIPQYGSANFSPAISQPDSATGLASVSKTLISEDQSGNLTLLQQTMDTGIWKNEPFYLNDDTALFTIKSYTISITVHDAKRRPIRNGEVMLTASSTLTAINNGWTYTLSSLGSWIPLDEHGELNLIIATSGITGQALTISQIREQNKSINIPMASSYGPDGFVVDPSRKAMAHFSSITDKTDLTTLRTQSGKPLWNASNPPPSAGILAKSAKCISKCTASLDKFKPNGKTKKSTVSAQATKKRDDVEGDAFMEAFHWVTNEIDKAENWFINEVADAIVFVVTIYGEAKSFLLDCAEKVGEALTWLWNKIKLAWDTLKDWCGFLFEWDDILKTKNVVRDIVNGGLTFAEQKLTSADVAVGTFFDNVKDKFNKSTGKASSSASVGDAANAHDWGNNPNPCKTTRVKWMAERFKNGGGRDGTKLKAGWSDDTPPTTDPTWYDIFMPLGLATQKMYNDIAVDLGSIFNNTQSMTSKDVWSKFGEDLVDDMLDCVKTFAQMMIRLVEKLVYSFQGWINQEFHIPIIGELYKLKMGGTLNFLEIVSFIIGAPACILIKLITEKSPPDLPTIDADFLSSLSSGNQPADVEAKYTIYASAISIIVSVTGNLLDTIILIFKTKVQSIPKGVSWLSSSACIVLIKSLVGISSILTALPTNRQYPGTDERNWACYMGLIGIGSNMLFSFTPVGGDDSTKKCEMIDCVLAVVNFALYDAIYALELEATNDYPEKDKALSGIGIVENYFKLLVSIGRNVAVQYEEDQPEVAAIGLSMMVIAREELDVAKTATFGRISVLAERNPGPLPITTPRGVSLVP